MSLERFFIRSENALLIITDMQEKLAKAMKEEVLAKTVKNIITFIELCKLYQIPVIFTEQYPKGLGKTLEEIRSLLYEEAIEKLDFSCFGEEKFAEKNKKNLEGRRSFLQEWKLMYVYGRQHLIFLHEIIMFLCHMMLFVAEQKKTGKSV